MAFFLNAEIFADSEVENTPMLLPAAVKDEVAHQAKEAKDRAEYELFMSPIKRDDADGALGLSNELVLNPFYLFFSIDDSIEGYPGIVPASFLPSFSPHVLA